MREALLILGVVVILFALTAIRYRRQIYGIIGIARMLKEAKDGIAAGPNQIRNGKEKGDSLVNCSKCGVWVPRNRASRVGDTFLCLSECVKTAA
jgi:hypothetical protein